MGAPGHTSTAVEIQIQFTQLQLRFQSSGFQYMSIIQIKYLESCHRTLPLRKHVGVFEDIMETLTFIPRAKTLFYSTNVSKQGREPI